MRPNNEIERPFAKAAGRSPDDPPEMLVDDLVDGRLPCHILSEITKKLKRKIKAFVKARLMTKKDDTDFKKNFCGEGSIPVGKLEPLLAMYISMKEG